MPKLKDTRLEEKEEIVIHGSILADEFRDRTTGKRIDPLGNKVTVDEIDSGSAANKKVIVANGSGGASWGDPDVAGNLKGADVESGSVATMLGFDSEGKLVKGSVPGPKGGILIIKDSVKK